jgi:selenocysteine lyase/cysteine desulfurase
MTLSELLADEDLRRKEFPVVADQVYLAHAGVCPLPERVAAAVQRYAGHCAREDQENAFPEATLLRTRQLAASLLGARPGEIALVGPTSLALSLIASGLRFRKTDNIVIYFEDYPSNVYPWMALAESGVEVRLLNIRELGRIRPVDVLGQVDEQTRLVALASCHFISGYRIEVEAIGAELRKRNILFCLDAIQTLGAFPTPVGHVDFLAADSHKWLLGPCGAGILYVREELQDRLRPPLYGWHNVRCPDFVAQEQIVLRADARRYEAGTFNLLGLAGLHAALELTLELGVGNIAKELLRKRSLLVPELRAKGWSVLQADSAESNAGAILSCARAGTDLAALHATLRKEGIVTSLRADRAGDHYLRLSPHYYNTDAELRRVIELL